jgi:hypothetical protein
MASLAQPIGAKRAGGVIVGHIFLAIVIGVVGLFFLASGFQAYSDDVRWFAWIAIGTGLVAGALFVFLILNPERDEHRP